MIAERRWLLVLKSLADRGDLPTSAPITCNVIEDDIDATEIGLVENVVQEAKHPVDGQILSRLAGS